MTDETRLEHDRLLGEAAARLLADPAYRQARLDIRDAIVKEIVELDPADLEALRLAKAELTILSRLDKVLLARVGSGRLASNPAGKQIEESRLDVRQGARGRRG